MATSVTTKKQEIFFAKLFTGLTIFLGIICIAWSFIPAVGFIVWPMCMIALILVGFSYYYRSKHKMNKRWSVLALVLNLIAGSLGFINYLNHKDFIDFAFSPGSLEGKVVKLGIEDQKEREQQALLDSLPANVDTQSDSKDEQNEHETLVEPQNTSNLYVSIVDNLRIRSEPSLDSKVLYEIDFGENLKFLEEKSTESLELEIAGKERKDYWYKVISLKPFYSEGWVYGGAVQKADESSFINHKTDRVVRIFSNIGRDSVKSLTGISWGIPQVNYNGVMSYQQDNSGNTLRDGRFYFSGLSEAGNYDLEEHKDQQVYRGTYRNDIVQGTLESIFYSWETSFETRYGYKDGKCISYRMISSSEGEKKESVIKEPELLEKFSILDR